MKEADPDLIADLDARGLLLRSERPPPLLPPLLALRHAAPLLRQALLVHPHHRRARPHAGAQRRASAGTPSGCATGASASGSRATSTGPSRATATGARRCRCGAAATAARWRRSARSPSWPSAPPRRCAEPFDPHRPVRGRRAARPAPCGGEMRREPEVIDVWYDSGAMPFAQDHHPFATGGDLPGRLPADFICEALDQTRGWFYSLLAESTLLFDETGLPQRGLPGADPRRRGPEDEQEQGQRHRALDRPRPPGRRRLPLVPAHGAEPVGLVPLQPGGGRRGDAPVPADAVEHATRSWSRTRRCPTAGRRAARRPTRRTCARSTAGSCRGSTAPSAEVTERLEDFDATGAGRRARGVPRRPEQLVRPHGRAAASGAAAGRGRDGAGRADADAAFAHPPRVPRRRSPCWSRPFCPFVAEEMHGTLVAAHDPDGARERPPGRLAASPGPPRPGPRGRDGRRSREAVAVGRGARAEAKLKVRQPLAEAVVACPPARGGARSGPWSTSSPRSSTCAASASSPTRASWSTSP